MADTELDELESGLTSGFWQRLLAHADQEWGPAGRTYQSAIDKALTMADPSVSVARLREIRFAQAAVQALLAWPQERMNQLRTTHRSEPAGPNRRGGL